MIVTLAGHVDHGKTSIVKALTGVETDRLEEEKRRGLTIDLGFAYCDLAGVRVGFVDVPGHHRFIHNMIAGIAEQQHALLIVAADDGVMPQTKEHLQILALIGLQQGTVVINKGDLVSEDRVQSVRKQVQELIAPTFLRDANCIEVSAYTGRGIPELGEILTQSALEFQRTQIDRSFRLAIDRSFSPRGVGTVVTGTVLDGSVEEGQELTLSSPRVQVRVRSIVAKGIDSESASVGDRCGIQIAGVRASDVQRGAWLRDSLAYTESSHLTLHLQVLDDFPRIVRNWTPVHVYHATSHTQGRLALIDTQISPGQQGFVDLICNEPSQACVGDRVVIRDHDLQRTLGGGLVLATNQVKGRRRNPARLQMLNSILDFVLDTNFEEALSCNASFEVTDLDQYSRSWNLSPDSVRDFSIPHSLIDRESKVLGRDRYAKLQSRILQITEGFHELNPSIEGMRSSDYHRVESFESETLAFVLDHCVTESKLKLSSGRYSLPGWQPQLIKYNRELYDRVLPFIATHQPKSTGDISKALHIPLSELEREMQRFAKADLMVQVSARRYFTQEHLEKLKELVISLGKQGPFSVRNVRDASSIGRMIIIDVLEYFDRRRVTQRQGDQRVLLDP